MLQTLSISRLLALCALSLLIGRIECRRRSYAGYSVFRCKPQTDEQLAKLQTLDYNMVSWVMKEVTSDSSLGLVLEC